ncbi:MAG: ankyrin repeat domain-containing protein [Emcibacteraceae bacterium]|nr:ankyrin repeat domain-containing protein [Emcibacteraceae bacterium]MDG1859537.1 ankyrin repeat domain-containing protein [Emcibacteraceae bacterium]
MTKGNYFKLLFVTILTAFLSLPLTVQAQENSFSDTHNLLEGVKKKDYGKLQKYLAKGANVNTRDYDDGQTPLYYAASLKDTVMVTLLLKEEANPNIARRSTGETPLMVAVRLKSKEIVAMLISQKADVNIADRNGETSLYKAVRAQSRDSVKALLDVNADWAIADNTGRTPLDLAREDRRLRSMVRVLESSGAEY